MEEIKELEKEKVKIVLERTRTLSPKLETLIKIAAILIGIYEILFIFNFTYTLYDLFSRLGISIEILKVTFQRKQGEAFVLAMILLITYTLYPFRKREKELKKVPIYDYLLIILSITSMFYLFAVYNRYAEFAEVYMQDVIFGVLAIILVLEATRRVLGWVLPSVVIVFLIYGIYRIGFNWVRFTQQLYFDEGIFGIPDDILCVCLRVLWSVSS